MTLFVTQLAETVTIADLRELFAHFGRVEKLKRPLHHDTLVPRPFAFVTMADPEAEVARQCLDGQSVDGQPISVTVARERMGRPACSPR